MFAENLDSENETAGLENIKSVVKKYMGQKCDLSLSTCFHNQN